MKCVVRASLSEWIDRRVDRQRNIVSTTSVALTSCPMPTCQTNGHFPAPTSMSHAQMKYLRSANLLSFLLELLDVLLRARAALVAIRLDLLQAVRIPIPNSHVYVPRTALSLSDARPSSQCPLPSFCFCRLSCFFFSTSSARPSLSVVC